MMDSRNCGFKMNVNVDSITFSIKEAEFKMGGPSEAVAVPEGDPYEGSYDIVPKLEAQTLNTKYKQLMNDLTVKEIPRTDVSNIYGGLTVTIGGY